MLASFGRLAACAALAMVVLAGAARAQELVAPDVLVKDVTLEVVDVLLKDKEIRAGDRSKVIALIEAKVLPHFNFTAMTASAVGKNWVKASPEQKNKLTDEFRTLLVRTYSSAISAYRDQKFDFRPLRAKPTDTDVTVNVRVMQSGAQPVTIDYDMEKRPGGWKAWAVANANLNEVLGLEVQETLGDAREEMKKGVATGMTKDIFMEMKLEQALVEAKGYDLVVMGRPEGPGCYCAANTLLTNYLDRLINNYAYIVVDNEAGMEHLSRLTTNN